ncbi:MAG: hypothetical protein O7F76_07365, partial [Planctomycetota bacterium]|nr:hypothetical protein [Planctomycetota bacterium]
MMLTGCRDSASENGGPSLQASRNADESATVVDAGAETAVPKRSDIAEKHRWNLDDIFPNDAAFDAAFDEVTSRIEQLAALKGTLARSPDALLRALEFRDQTNGRFERVMLYCGLLHHQDMDVDAAQGRYDRAESLGTSLSEAMSWFSPEILRVPEETVSSWMDQNEKLAV